MWYDKNVFGIIHMKLGSFKFIPKSFLGVDIGTSSIKVVELSRWGTKKSLKNYGEIKSEVLYDKPFRTAEKSSLLLSSKDIARALLGILEEAKIETKDAVFSIPDFSSFFTHFELPHMTKEELPEAVRYEARKHVPLPFSEVTFDWQILNKKRFGLPKEPVKILMVAVPNELINQYQEIALLAKLRLSTLEAEVFGLIRSSLKNEEESVVMLDMGAQTTTINVVKKGILQSSRSIDIGGGNFSERIAQSLSISRKEAEEKKMTEGLLSEEQKTILSPLIDTVVMEIKRAIQEFKGKEIQRVVLGGGSSLLLGLKEYLKENLNMEIEFIDPFRSVFYPPVLEDTIKEMGPSYAVAVGMALRGLE
ncbi:type IV pilus assembly protein PilM [Patescibacteria group bacterium]|nr:type IV pilus assembly protein PilM [Patescibacteria group bacterium]